MLEALWSHCDVTPSCCDVPWLRRHNTQWTKVTYQYLSAYHLQYHSLNSLLIQHESNMKSSSAEIFESCCILQYDTHRFSAPGAPLAPQSQMQIQSGTGSFWIFHRTFCRNHHETYMKHVFIISLPNWLWHTSLSLHGSDTYVKTLKTLPGCFVQKWSENNAKSNRS